MDGASLLIQLRKQIALETGHEPTDVACAAYLDVNSAKLAQIKAEQKLSPLRVARLLRSCNSAARKQVNRDLIRTVVEFFPIKSTTNGRGGVSEELFNITVDGGEHPYRSGLKDELEAAHGVYIFYDSRGRALYTGKAKEQSLWKEMNLAFNRPRGERQSVARVEHPNNRVPFRRSEEKRRQIVTRQVPLSELANYFSAYAIDRDAIDALEALLIRAFPNDLLNKKRETIGKSAPK